MRAIGFLLLLAGVQAQAQWSFTLEPASPIVAWQEVAVRIDASLGCFHSDLINVTRDGATVRVVARIEDASPPGPCPSAWLTPRFVSLGTFAPGHYEVQVTACSNPPPPLPECVLQATLPLTVLGVSETPFTVPTMSGTIALALAFALMAIGVFAVRRE